MGDSKKICAIEVLPDITEKTVTIGMSEDDAIPYYTAFFELHRDEAVKMAKAILAMCEEMD
jgi:hypothetical protein